MFYYHINEKNKGLYKVEAFCKIKISEEWIAGICYKSIIYGENQVYTRTIEDFNKNFREIQS
jgi:hypothetical protein